MQHCFSEAQQVQTLEGVGGEGPCGHVTPGSLPPSPPLGGGRVVACAARPNHSVLADVSLPRLPPVISLV